MTINSDIDIHLGKVPDVDDPSLYEALLAVHNALEILLTELQAEWDRDIAVTPILTVDSTIASYQNLILTDTTSGNVNLTFPAAADVTGKRFTVKQTAGANTTVVAGSGGELIDGAATLNVALLAAKTLASDGTNWWVI